MPGESEFGCVNILNLFDSLSDSLFFGDKLRLNDTLTDEHKP
jgi:hypothetical protein